MAPLYRSLIFLLGLNDTFQTATEASIRLEPMFSDDAPPSYFMIATVPQNAYRILKKRGDLVENWDECPGIAMGNVCAQNVDEYVLQLHRWPVQDNCPGGVVADRMCVEEDDPQASRRMLLIALAVTVVILAWFTWACCVERKFRTKLGIDECFCKPDDPCYNIASLTWILSIFVAGPFYLIYKIVMFLPRKIRQRFKSTTATAAAVPSPREPPPPYSAICPAPPTATPVQRPGGARAIADNRRLRRSRRIIDAPPAYSFSGEASSADQNDDTNDEVPASGPARVRNGSPEPRRVDVETT